MGRSTLIALAFAAACSGSDLPPPTRPDGGDFCTAGSHTCPAGTRCVNSYCVPACTGGAQCPAGTYCAGASFPDDVCAPITAVACTTSFDCPAAQSCDKGHCVSLEAARDGGAEGCTPNVAQDNCAPDAVCTVLNNPTTGTTPVCLGLSLCGEDGGCPAGQVSRACNLQPDGGHIFAGKGPICLLTQCWTSSDCISAAVCDNPGDGGPGKCRCVITTADAGPCAP